MQSGLNIDKQSVVIYLPGFVHSCLVPCNKPLRPLLFEILRLWVCFHLLLQALPSPFFLVILNSTRGVVSHMH